MIRSGCWRLVLVGLAAGVLVACTGEEAPPPEPPPPTLPPAEQRLQFSWEETVEVPASARAAVDMVREWQYAYNLWDTDGSIVSPFLERHTGAEILGQIRSISAKNLQSSGPIRVVLVGVDIEEDEGTVEVCEERSERFLLDRRGQPRAGPGGITGHRLELVRLRDGRWIVDNNPWSSELEDRCQLLFASGDLPTPPAGDS